MGLLCDILENMKKNDMILAAVLLALALVTGGVYYGLHRSPAAYAEVSVDGTVVEKLDLTVDREYTVESADGGVNRLVVEDGSVWCEEANCPDALCVRQGKQNRDGSVIVCLPHRMIVKIIGEAAE